MANLKNGSTQTETLKSLMIVIALLVSLVFSDKVSAGNLTNKTSQKSMQNASRGPSTSQNENFLDSPDGSTKHQALIDKAQGHFDAKQFDAAIKTLVPVNDTLPRSGLLLLARSYAAKRETLDEVRTLELCIAKNPKDYVVHTVYGNTLVKIKNRVEDGLFAFQEARKLNPRYLPAHESLLRELEKKGERYEARNVVQDMIKVFGTKPAFDTALCRLYTVDGFHEKSLEHCERAIRSDPKVPDNHVYLGLSLKETEDLEGAKAVLNKASSRFPASETVHTAMGDLYLSKKDYVHAYEYYKKAIGSDPKSSRAWVGHANSSFQLQKTQEALSSFIKACKNDKLETKDFRSAIGLLRVRKDFVWQHRFEAGINECQ